MKKSAFAAIAILGATALNANAGSIFDHDPTLVIINNGSIPASPTAPRDVITSVKLTLLKASGKYGLLPLPLVIKTPTTGLHIGPYDQALNIKYDHTRIPKSTVAMFTTVESVTVQSNGQTLTVQCNPAVATITNMISVNVLDVNNRSGKYQCVMFR